MRRSEAPRVLVIDAADNVATTLAPLQRGTRLKVDGRAGLAEVSLSDEVPFGHKFALAPILQGADVIKYGVVIAQATRDIHPGEHVHVHNIESKRGRGDLR